MSEQGQEHDRDEKAADGSSSRSKEPPAAGAPQSAEKLDAIKAGGKGLRGVVAGALQKVATGPGAAAKPGAAGRFDKFTERAKKVLTLAQEEAQRYNHNYIGTEHLLLGLIREGEGVAARVLADVGVDLEDARKLVQSIIGRGDRFVFGEISLTPRSKKVIELAVDEARRHGDSYVGTEHLLLGLVREGEGIGAGVLERLGADFGRLRNAVVKVWGSPGFVPEAMGTKDSVVTCRIASEDLAALDMLVEAGIRSTRSDAAQWLIHAGIKANKPLFDQVGSTVAEIRRLRNEARRTAWRIAEEAEEVEDGDGEDTPPATRPADESAAG